MTDSPYRFGFEPIFLIAALAGAFFYFRAAGSSSPDERPGRGRSIVFVAGLLLIAIPLNSPLETLAAHYLLLAHLFQNALIADWGPPALILGLSLGMRRRLAGAGGKTFQALTRPRVSLPIWLAVWYGVHLPPFYDWALRDGWPLNLEHALLIGAGFVFWWPVFEHPPRIEPLGVLAYLGIGFVTAPWLSLAYIFSSHPFYSFYEHAPRLWGLSATRDQNFAGILMNADQTSIFLIAFAWYLLRVLAEETAAQQRRDDAFLATLDARTRAEPPTAEPQGGTAHG
jgi:putative membrane protein